ncbi:MAG TPA: uridine diphosphate-N-acetylglucosamine-binding protein YvcK, partial [Candidatus Omnitrophota bacterium]|nr:uridine diphosphate-N-acetylglucosamine-binding protein YvcK [Candidatus Omnitrophota bacterium]
LLTSIVSMTDDGGSTGRLRESFGTLPPGDLRMSLVALSRASILMNKVLQYRFQSGGECFTGHNIGNLVLVALSEIFGSMKQGIKNLGEILNIQGIVIPVTMTNARLNAQFEDGTVIKGETRIDLGEGRNPELRIKKIWHEPPTECDTDAYVSILCADAVVIGPGDLYTSVITNLEVGRLKDAVVKTSAKKIYICNLMTKPGETNDYSAYDHVKDIIAYLGCDCLDYVIISDTSFSRETLDSYTGEGQFQVMVDHGEEFSDITKARIIIADVAHGDGLIRHDGSKIRNVIEKILRGPK